MKYFLCKLALVCILCASAAVTVSISPPQVNAQPTATQSDLAAKSAKTDALLAPFAQPNTPGIAVLVIYDGQVVHNKGYGLARLDTKEAIGAETAFDLASTSKPFTAMAVMMLAEQEKLSYNDPLSKYFPDFPNYAQKVTIRHLLTHTSGLPDVINASWFKADYVPTSRQVAAFFVKAPNAKSAPGDRFEYNNSGYLLLALIVEKASGKSFAAFMRENIFKPLGMNNSLIWDDTTPKVEHLAISYAPVAGGFEPVPVVSDKFIYGAKGVVSTIDDLAKWIKAFESGKLVKPETFQIALTPSKLNDGSQSPYGFGWGLGSDGGLPTIEHPGGYLGYRTNIRIYPTQRTAIAVLSNNANADAQTLARNTSRIYLSDKMSAPQPKVKLDPVLLNSYVGRYKSESAIAPDLMIEITNENGDLFITSALRPKAKLIAQSETEFQIAETSATVTFNRGDRSVTGLTLKTRMGVINARRVN